MQNRSRYGNMNWSGGYDDQYGQYGQNYQYNQYNQYDDYEDYNQYGGYQGSMGMQRNMMGGGRNRLSDNNYNQGFSNMGMGGYGGDGSYMDYGQSQMMGSYNQGNNRRFGSGGGGGGNWGNNSQRKRTASRSMNEPQSKRTKSGFGQDTNRRSANSNMASKGRGGQRRMGDKKSVDKNAPRQYCEVCESTFPTERALRQHLNGRRHKLRKESKETTSGPGELGPGPFRPFCQTCVDRFEEQSWQKHKETPKHIARASLNIFVKKDQDEPEGVEYVEPVSGFYCSLCTRFYSDEEHAMGAHCKNKAHAYKVKKLEISKLTDAEIQEYVQQKKDEHDAQVAEQAGENGVNEGDANEEMKQEEEVDEDKLLADDEEMQTNAGAETKTAAKATPPAAGRGRMTRSAIKK